MIARKARPLASRRSTSTLVIECPRVECVLLDSDRCRLVSAVTDRLQVASSTGPSQSMICAVRSVSITYKPEQPEQRVIARSIVKTDQPDHPDHKLARSAAKELGGWDVEINKWHIARSDQEGSLKRFSRKI